MNIKKQNPNITNRVIKKSGIELVNPFFKLGRRVYQDYITLILNLAIYRIYGVEKRLSVEHSIADGVYCELWKNTNSNSKGTLSKLTIDEIKNIKNEMKKINKENLKIEQILFSVDDAIRIMKKLKRYSVIKNLELHDSRFVRLYKIGDYYDYYYRTTPDHTGYSIHFDVVQYEDGLVLRFIYLDWGKDTKKFKIPKILFKQFQEHEHWLKILNMETVGDLNRVICDKKIRDFILTEEALHEKKIANIADKILEKKTAKFILIAGPSSSGKTTFAKRLSIQLKVNGYDPYVLSLDDYFLPRIQTPKLPNGEYDFEGIGAMDLKLLNTDLSELLKGKEVRLPRYNFMTGERELSNHYLKLGSKNIVVIEGIHGLNEKLTSAIPAKNKVKVYISPLNILKIDHHNRIPTSDFRKFRRMIRDAQYRNFTAEETLSRWTAIADGENKNIFPFQEEADLLFNSSLTYEIGVLRKHATPLLRAIQHTSPVYQKAQDLLTLIEHFMDIKDELVPHNSLLREFISNSVFEY